MLVLEAGDARVEVDAEAGGRLASLRVGELELLVGPHAAAEPEMWGCYPMAPFAGRVRRGRFAFDGRTYQLPVNFPPHAIHGTAYRRSWAVSGDGELAVDLGPEWPFPGRAVQRFRLEAEALHLTLEVHAAERAMPASCGWHPWWRRDLGAGQPLELAFEAAAMWIRDDDHIPTGELVPPPPGPWDDCFTGLARPPVVRWPGALELTVESDCDHVVVYDQLDHAACVEPQTHPPDALNLGAARVEPDAPLVAHATFRWRTLP